jgi:biotin carboxylase
MLKASAGGGGKGMRLVCSAAELQSAFETRSPAAAAFGNAACIWKAVGDRGTSRFRSLLTRTGTWSIWVSVNVRFNVVIKK